MESRYTQYLKSVARPFKKLTKLDFLQPDNSVAFSIGSANSGYYARHKTNAFIQGGSLNVSLNNGQRRSATVTLSNIDRGFTHSANNIWFGQKVRLSMGLVLPDGYEYYFPQGVFYIKEPQEIFKPSSKQVSFPLVDKWAMLDGSLGGVIPNTYVVKNKTDEAGNITEYTNVFEAIKGILQRSKYTFDLTENSLDFIDNVTPIFTTYYNDKYYNIKVEDVIKQVKATDLPYDITESVGGTAANLILSLVDCFVGSCGYDATGAFRVEPSQEDISDDEKPILWTFTPEEKQLLGITETLKKTEIYNDVLIVGEGATDGEVWGRARNFDPKSDTNINLIGLKTFVESRAEYWTAKQCADMANWYLKRKSVAKKSITIESSQMFHLTENGVIAIKRTDKPNSPIEKHVINSYTIPLSEKGSMTINATSINDIANPTISMYPDLE